VNRTIVLACCMIAATPVFQLSARGFTLQYNGVMGQSQPADTRAHVDPIPYLDTVGVVTDAKGLVWTGSGTLLSVFSKNAGQLKLVREVQIPSGINPGAHLMTDGQRLYFAGANTLYALDTSNIEAAPYRFCSLPDNWRAMAMAPSTLSKGFAAKYKLLVLTGLTVIGIDSNGEDRGPVITLPPPIQGAAYYNTIGIEPTSGDLLVGGYYPDISIYRFTSDGVQVTNGGWPRNGFASNIVNAGGTPWALYMGGGAQSLPTPLDPTNSVKIERDWTYYGSGLVDDGIGGYWVATSQGLCHFDKNGKALHQRVGGLPDVNAAAIDSDGVLIAGGEGGGRLVRLMLDDDPDSSLSSNGDDAWRIGRNWTSHAVGIAADGETFLVLDDKSNQIWRFDPALADQGENAWSKEGSPAGLSAPLAIAVGDALAWVIDAGKILEGPSIDLSKAHVVTLPGAPDLSQYGLIAASGDSLICVSDGHTVEAFERKSDGSYDMLWNSPDPFSKVTGIAWTKGGVAVSDGGTHTITLLAASTGAQLAKLDSTAVPGGLEPGAIASEGSWLVVVDKKNDRLVRIRVRS